LSETNATGIVRPRFVVHEGGRKHKALKRRRAFQRNHKRWATWRDSCASGRVVALRATEGRARPYELGDVAYALRQVCSRRAVDALAWVLACERGFAGKRGVIVQHPDLAVMLGCCPKSAGDAMRELVELGLVEQRPHFIPAEGTKARDDRSPLKVRWYERTPAYQTTAKCRDVVAKRDVRIARRRGSLLVGKNYQPSESAANPPGSQKKGVPGRGRPEQAFVEAVLTQRRADAKPVAQLVARFRGGDTTGLRHRWQPSEAELLARGSNKAPPIAKRHPASCACDECIRDVIAGAHAAFAAFEARKGGDAAK